MDYQGSIYTNDNCISCNRCVKVCTSPGASYLRMSGGVSAVHIDSQRCISCGACFSFCEHGAREYRDDTEEFFRDLAAGESISVLFAPSFCAAYPDEYASVLGGLRDLGVRHLIPVSFGADICTWAYLRYMEREDFYGGISTPCPVTVAYVERCLPELIPLLMPVQSPLCCAATYCREELGIGDRLAFIGPCIGKKMETDAYVPSPIHYNITFLKLMDHVRSNVIYGPDATGDIEYGLGSFYPAPGGLAENIRWFLGDDTQIRVVSGKAYLYGWLRKNRQQLLERRNPFLLIDALNCQDGCIEGTASETERFGQDRLYYDLRRIRNDSRRSETDSPWNESLSPAERLEKLNERFKGLSLSHYLRSFVDRSASCAIRCPSEDEAERIYRSMHKITEESRRINCASCGYSSCHDMMVAIYNQFNDRRSCIYYEKEETLRLERMSLYDQLTSVMNRNALQRMEQGLAFHDRSLAVIVADINGLKETNDTLGHEAGDRLIMTVAAALTAVFGRENVYRTGGDEFLVIVQDHHRAECERDIRRVRDLLDAQGASAAFGAAFSERFDSELDRMKADADREMYLDKDAYYRRTGKKRR